MFCLGLIVRKCNDASKPNVDVVYLNSELIVIISAKQNITACARPHPPSQATKQNSGPETYPAGVFP